MIIKNNMIIYLILHFEHCNILIVDIVQNCTLILCSWPIVIITQNAVRNYAVSNANFSQQFSPSRMRFHCDILKVEATNWFVGFTGLA